MSRFITEDLCEERHRRSEDDINEIKDILKWVNRELIIGLLSIIGILIIALNGGKLGKTPLKVISSTEASTMVR